MRYCACGCGVEYTSGAAQRRGWNIEMKDVINVLFEKYGVINFVGYHLLAGEFSRDAFCFLSEGVFSYLYLDIFENIIELV